MGREVAAEAADQLEDDIFPPPPAGISSRGGRGYVVAYRGPLKASRPLPVPSAASLPNDPFEDFQIDVSSADDGDDLLALELLFSFDEAPDGQRP